MGFIMLSQKAIEEFREIYFNKFGKQLSVEEATKKALNLIRLYKSILCPSDINSENVKEL